VRIIPRVRRVPSASCAKASIIPTIFGAIITAHGILLALDHGRPIPSALFGLIIVPSILIPSGLVGALHAWRHGSQWHEARSDCLSQEAEHRKYGRSVISGVVLIIALGAPTAAV